MIQSRNLFKERGMSENQRNQENTRSRRASGADTSNEPVKRARIASQGATTPPVSTEKIFEKDRTMQDEGFTKEAVEDHSACEDEDIASEAEDSDAEVKGARSYIEVLQRNHDWWMDYDPKQTTEISICDVNNPVGNITKTAIMKQNSHWSVEDMQDLNRHVITICSQDHTSSNTDIVYSAMYAQGFDYWWTNKDNLVVGESYTRCMAQRPYIELLCSAAALEHLKTSCETDDLVECKLNTDPYHVINLTKSVYYEPGTDIEVARHEYTNWRPHYGIVEEYWGYYNCTTEDLAFAFLISRAGYGEGQDSKNKDFLKRAVELAHKIP